MNNYPSLIYQYHNINSNFNRFYLTIDLIYDKLFENYNILKTEDQLFEFRIHHIENKPDGYMNVCIEAQRKNASSASIQRFNYKRIF